MSKNKKNSLYGVDFLSLCDYVMVSQDQKMSVLGIFDRIFVRQLPAVHSRCFIVAIVRGPANAECHVKIELISPEGKEIQMARPISLQVKLGQNGVGNVINELVNLPIATSGQYKVRILINGAELKHIPLYVQKLITNEKPGNPPN